MAEHAIERLLAPRFRAGEPVPMRAGEPHAREPIEQPIARLTRANNFGKAHGASSKGSLGKVDRTHLREAGVTRAINPETGAVGSGVGRLFVVPGQLQSTSSAPITIANSHVRAKSPMAE